MSGVALIAGGTRGLGLAVARRLATEGERLFLVARAGGPEPELAAGTRAEVLRLDLSEPGASARAVAAVLERAGRIDRAVYAIGDVAHGPLAELDGARLSALWHGNVAGALEFAQAVRAPLRATRGALLFFGVAGAGELRARRTIAGYAAAKSALCVLARSLALEEGPHGVRVNVLAPGLVPHASAAPETLRADAARRVPLGRAGTHEEVVEAAAWLLSDDASYVTGVVLDVSGGYPR